MEPELRLQIASHVLRALRLWENVQAMTNDNFMPPLPYHVLTDTHYAASALLLGSRKLRVAVLPNKDFRRARDLLVEEVDNDEQAAAACGTLREALVEALCGVLEDGDEWGKALRLQGLATTMNTIWDYWYAHGVWEITTPELGGP